MPQCRLHWLAKALFTVLILQCRFACSLGFEWVPVNTVWWNKDGTKSRTDTLEFLSQDPDDTYTPDESSENSIKYEWEDSQLYWDWTCYKPSLPVEERKPIVQDFFRKSLDFFQVILLDDVHEVKASPED